MFFSLGKIRLYLCWQPPRPVCSTADWIWNVCLALNGATLVGFSGKTHCCWSVQLSVRTHCSVFTHHSSGAFQKSLKNKWVAAFALLNFVVICPSITDCWFERSHLSPQGQYLDATSAESHPQMHPNDMTWVGFSLSHPTAGKMLRPHHTECCRSSSTCPAELTHSNTTLFSLPSTFDFNFYNLFKILFILFLICSLPPPSSHWINQKGSF